MWRVIDLPLCVMVVWGIGVEGVRGALGIVEEEREREP